MEKVSGGKLIMVETSEKQLKNMFQSFYSLHSEKDIAYLFRYACIYTHYLDGGSIFFLKKIRHVRKVVSYKHVLF
jgi:hypothetical protein